MMRTILRAAVLGPYMLTLFACMQFPSIDEPGRTYWCDKPEHCADGFDCVDWFRVQEGSTVYLESRRFCAAMGVRQIVEVEVSTSTPTDILFVVDNSGSMGDEIALLRDQIGLFLDELSKSNNDFQVGLITTDVDCNVPSMDCTPVTGRTFRGCCNTPGRTLCQDEDTNSDGVVDRSDCDGGRLRAASTGRRIFTRPEADSTAQAAWVAEVGEILDNLGTDGSSYEAGLEAARRAVACAIGTPCTASDQLDCCPAEDAAVADLNAGFIRPEADLVVIFFSDEEDCSVTNRDAYYNPATLSSAAYQTTNFCSPNECYMAYERADTTCSGSSDCLPGWGCNTTVALCQIDADNDGIADWADADASGFFRCGNPAIATYERLVNPPELSATDGYIDTFVALKGGVLDRFRAAAIVSTVPATAQSLGYIASACVNDATGPSDSCGCWATAPAASSATSFYCNLTETIGQGSDWTPVLTDGSGCKAMPSGRYVEFLEKLARDKVTAGGSGDTLIESICRAEYSQTLTAIVRSVILSNCVDIWASGASDNMIVSLNGAQLNRVEVGSDQPGWSYVPGATELCLEGGLTKSVGDMLEIRFID